MGLRDNIRCTRFDHVSLCSTPLSYSVILLKVSKPVPMVYGHCGAVTEYKHGIQLVSSIDGKVSIL